MMNSSEFGDDVRKVAYLWKEFERVVRKKVGIWYILNALNGLAMMIWAFVFMWLFDTHGVNLIWLLVGWLPFMGMLLWGIWKYSIGRTKCWIEFDRVHPEFKRLRMKYQKEENA